MRENDAHPFACHPSPAAEYARVLGFNVKRLREKSRLNKKTLCLMANISRPFLDSIERGQSNPQLNIIVRLAKALDVTPEELITPPFDDVPIEAY